MDVEIEANTKGLDPNLDCTLVAFPQRAPLENRPAAPHCSANGPLPADDYLLRPDPSDPRLTERVRGIDQSGAPLETSVTVERALTIFLNAQEIVTAMTINDYPEYLALGYLLNQSSRARPI